MRPFEEEALELHRKYGSSDQIVRHCRTVETVARILARELKSQGREVDIEAVSAAALLHDIGRNRTQTVRHGLEGSEILRSEGVEEVVIQIVRKHVGAGIAPAEANTLGLPDLDYAPKTTEEVLVCFADKMVDADRVRPFQEEVKRFERKGHDVERLRALRRRVETEIGRDPESLIFDKIKES